MEGQIEGQILIVTCTIVPIRSEPRVASDTLLVGHERLRGEALKVLEQRDNWCRVQDPFNVGSHQSWVCVYRLLDGERFLAPATLPLVYRVLDAFKNVREEPNGSAKVVPAHQKLEGDIVTANDVDMEWIRLD